MKIAVIGAGGVGGYFGGRLAKAGNDVTFVARGAQLKAMQKHGLKVNSISGNFEINPVKVTDNFRVIHDPGLIILGVKAWQVKEVAVSLRPVLVDETIILPLQNGISAVEELKEVVEGHHVIGGLCRIISRIEAPGVISHEGVEPTIIFGETDNNRSERILTIKKLFDAAGFSSIIAQDIHAELWKKFISICSGGLLALSRSSYGAVRENSYTRKMMTELLTEIYEIALKEEVNLEPGIVGRMIRFIDTLPYQSMASLARDVMEGRPSEIDYQNGTVVSLGEKHHIDTPVNRFVYSCILPMEQKARKQ